MSPGCALVVSNFVQRKSFVADSFETRTVKLEKGDMIYTLTDGYQDQFGGPKGKKFMVRKLKNLLAEIAPSDVNSQKSVIESTFINWKGEEEQIDDVLLIGIRV